MLGKELPHLTPAGNTQISKLGVLSGGSETRSFDGKCGLFVPGTLTFSQCLEEEEKAKEKVKDEENKIR